MTGIEIALGAGVTVAIASIGFGAKTLLTHNSRIAVVEAVHGETRADVVEIKTDVKEVGRKLERLLGREEAKRR